VSDLLLTKGGLAVSELADEIDTELAAERTKLDEQHALDNLALLSDDASPLVDTIEASEEDEQAIADDLRPWITEVLRLRQQPHRAEAGDTLRFFWDSDTLLPKIPWRATLDVALDRLSTWSRTRAQSPNGPSPALLRPGSPLFDALERVARWDDRGIAYATWRVEPGWPEVFRGFRLVWVVEPSVSIAGPVWGRDSAAETLRRRAEALLPVATYEQFLDDSGEQVTDPSLLRVLFRDYREGLGDGARDINLGSRPKAMEQAIDAGLLREIVARVRAAGGGRGAPTRG
jgi:ATP-dependent helicase HepA